MDPPSEEKLERLLEIYGGMKKKSFYERVRKYKKTMTIECELLALIPLLNSQQLASVLSVSKLLLERTKNLSLEFPRVERALQKKTSIANLEDLEDETRNPKDP